MARIITSEDDVPDGFIRIADVTDNATDAKILSDAHTNGDLDAVKLIRTTSEIRTGPVWVDKIAAGALLSRCQAKRDSERETDARALSVAMQLHGGLRELPLVASGDQANKLLERIAVAIEAIASRLG
jgi:hypothetical protein